MRQSVRGLLSDWCGDFQTLPAEGIMLPSDLSDLRDSLAQVPDAERLDTSGLARRICQVWWLREVGLDLWISLLSGAGDWWPPSNYPDRVEVPASTWYAADGSDDDTWLVDLLASLVCLRRRLPKLAEIKEDLADPKTNVGELPALMAALWLRRTDAWHKYRERTERKVREIRAHWVTYDRSWLFEQLELQKISPAETPNDE